MSTDSTGGPGIAKHMGFPPPNSEVFTIYIYLQMRSLDFIMFELLTSAIFIIFEASLFK
jgi:hypothetical protein